jgi:hypothetical protein
MTQVRAAVTMACAGACAFALTSSSGCLNLDGTSCTAIGCIDQASIELVSPTGAWGVGSYELTATEEVATEGGTSSCVLQIPAAPSPTTPGLATCTGPLGLAFESDTTCQTFQNGQATGQRCASVPGHSHMTATVAGTPGQVRLTLARNGSQLLDTQLALAYHEFQPNGPQCGPGCQEASANLSVVGAPETDSGAADSDVGDAASGG